MQPSKHSTATIIHHILSSHLQLGSSNKTPGPPTDSHTHTPTTTSYNHTPFWGGGGGFNDVCVYRATPFTEQSSACETLKRFLI